MGQQAQTETRQGAHISIDGGFGGVLHMHRHVDRMLYEEATRIIQGYGDSEGQRAASSFMTEEAAEVILDDLIASRQDEIGDWLRDHDSNRLAISKQYGSEDIARLRVPVSGLGLVVDRATWKIWVAKSSNAVAVLRRNKTQPAGYEVVTMFPAVDEPEPVGERLDIDPLPYLMASPQWACLSAVRREGFALMCEHEGLPIHYDRHRVALVVPAMKNDEKVGDVFVGESDASVWVLDGCSSVTLPREFARVVMGVALPETWNVIEGVYRGIEKYRYDMFLEGKQKWRSFVTEPFLPDVRIREIMSEADKIIREAELADRRAGEDANLAPVETEQRNAAGRRRGERLASRMSERDRQVAERQRRQQESQLERSRRREERTREAKAPSEHTPKRAPATDNARQGWLDAVPYEWRNRIVTPSIASLGPLEYWHVPLYDPDTNDILVTMVGVLDRIATGDDGSEVLAGLVLHADAGDIDATFERMAELNEDGLRVMGDARRRVTEGRPDGEVTMLDERSGYPVAGDDGLLHVNDADRYEARRGRNSVESVFRPQWWDEVGERPPLVVETPFPRNLAHLVDEGRYDIVTLGELDRIRNGATEWLPIAHADVTTRLGIQASIDDGPARPSRPASWPSDKSEPVSSDTGARILTLPAFCTKAVPDIAYWNDEEMLVSLVAEAVAHSAEDSRDGSPMAPGQADAIPCFEDLTTADCDEDPRERLRAMMALGTMMDAKGMPDRMPLLTPSQIIASFIEADEEYEAWKERFGHLEQDGREDGMSSVPTTRRVSRQKVIMRRA